MAKEFMGIKGVAQLIDRIKSDLNTKQDKVTGTAGQFIGFDAQGNPVAQTVEVSGGGSDVTVNNTLTSTSTTEALSANQGKVLKDLVDAKVPNTRTVNNKALSADISLSAADVGAVPTTRTINGKALSSNVTLVATDVNAVACAVPMTLSVTADGVLRVTY